MNSRSALSKILMVATLANVFMCLIAAQKTDFDVFENAARIVLGGHGRELYRTAVQDSFSNGLWIQGHGYFYHPPYEVFLFFPFVHLSRDLGFWLWNLSQSLLIVFAVWRLSKLFPSTQKRIRYFLPFAMFPAASMLWWGQDSGLLFLCFALAFVAFVEEKWLRCGLWLGASVLKFQYAIPLVAFLALRKKPRIAFGFAISAFVAVAISYWIVGSSGFADYISFGHGEQEVLRMVTLRGLVEFIGAPEKITVLITVILSAAIFAAALKLKCDRHTEFSIAVIMALVLSYHAFAYDFVLLVIPVWLFLEQTNFAPTGVRALALALLICSPAWFVLERLRLSPLMVLPCVMIAKSLLERASNPSQYVALRRGGELESRSAQHRLTARGV